MPRYRITPGPPTPDDIPDDPAFLLNSATTAPEGALRLGAFAERQNALTSDRLLEPNSHIIVDAAVPLERYAGGYDRLITNLRHGVKITYLMGANQPDAIGRLTRCLCRPSLRKRATLALHTPIRDDGDDWTMILAGVRIIVIPLHTSPDYLYIVNATSPVNAQLYECNWILTQERTW
jgi:hypothetical protein